MHIVLFQPEIPANTGNIVRTCAVVGAGLTLIEPLGFSLSNRQMRRSGLDYWDAVNVKTASSLDEVLENQRFWLFSSKGTTQYSDVTYQTNDLLIFGSETSGLPPEIMERHADRIVTLPMRPGQRCLNLSNSVSIALYEAWRQQGFEGSA